VEDLLDFGRMESGRKQYQIEPHDLFGVVRAVVADFREEALAGGFEVELNLDANAPTVKADEEELRWARCEYGPPPLESFPTRAAAERCFASDCLPPQSYPATPWRSLANARGTSG
jgi:hypothetical protein